MAGRLWIFREGYVPERQKSHLYRNTIEVSLWTRVGWPTSLQYGFQCDMNLLDVCLESESSKSDSQLSISYGSRQVSLRSKFRLQRYEYLRFLSLAKEIAKAQKIWFWNISQDSNARSKRVFHFLELIHFLECEQKLFIFFESRRFYFFIN